MTLPAVRQLFLLCLFGIFGCLNTTGASLFDQWEDERTLRQVRGIQSEDLSNVLWGDQNELCRRGTSPEHFQKISVSLLQSTQLRRSCATRVSLSSPSDASFTQTVPEEKEEGAAGEDSRSARGDVVEELDKPKRKREEENLAALPVD